MGKKSISFDDFVAYRPMHNYIFLPTREPWPAASINAQLSPVLLTDKNGKPVLDDDGEEQYIKANVWLDQHRPVHQMTWAPGLPMFIPDKVVAEGGWIDKAGAICLNLYRPPTLKGKAGKVKPWLDHVRKVYPNDANYIIVYLAQRVQRPEVKINHGLFLGGAQGIGKDTLLEPAKQAVGPWNFEEISPADLFAPFNGYRKSVILRISEARDLGESSKSRYDAYETMKTLSAAPPDVLRVNEKNLREHYIVNVCGIIITSNYKTDGIYLPPDDRRTYVAWSDLVKGDFSPGYWKKLWRWYAKGGIEHVIAYLAKLDISAFDPKAPPPKTQAFWDIVDANRAPELSELADVLDKMENPAATTLAAILGTANGDIYEWLDDRKNRRAIPHRMEKCGYAPLRNDVADDGLWKVNGARQVIYTRSDLPLPDRFKAARILIKAAAASNAQNGAPRPPQVRQGPLVRPKMQQQQGKTGVRFVAPAGKNGQK